MNKLIPFCVMLALLTLTFASTSSATCVYISPEELIQLSDYVVHGIATELNSHWTENHRWIYTLVTFEVLEVLKGELSDTSEVIIYMEGGKIGESQRGVSDQAVIEQGMELIAHLTLLENGYFVIRGCEEGAYYIKDGILRSESGKVNMSLDQFRKFVNEVVRQGR